MNDLQEILARDPRGFVREPLGPELRAIVEILRASRGQYNLGNVKAGSTKPKTEKAKAVAGIDLGDIQL